MKAVVLAGGEATRMQPVAKWLPKCLLPVNGIPFLVRSLKKISNVVDDIIVVTEKDKSKAILYQLNVAGIDATVLTTEHIISQRDKILLATTEDKERFLLLFADSFCDADIRNAMKIDADAVIFVCKKLPVEYGVVKIENNQVVSFSEKKYVEVPFWTGIGIFRRRLFTKYPFPEVSQVLEHAAKKEKIVAVECQDFYDVGSISAYKRTLEEI